MESLINNLSEFSLIRLSENEKSEFAGHLSEMQKMIDVIFEVETRNVEPMINPVEKTFFMRDDIGDAGISLTDALKNAPTRVSGKFTLPNNPQ